MLHKRTNRDLLRRTSPGEGGYPAAGGALPSVHADYQARAWGLKWRASGETPPGELSLAATADNGLVLTRRLRLTDFGLEEETSVSNPGAEPVAAVLRSSIDLDPGEIDSASVRFRRVDGGETVRPLIRPEEPPTGLETWSGGALPAGQWRLENARAGLLAASRFDPQAVERAQLSWTGKDPRRATLVLWSKPAALRTGETLRLRTEHGLPAAAK